MSTLKDDYIRIRENTVLKFFESFKKAITYYDSDQTYPPKRYKNAITDLKMDNSIISFEFLYHKIILKYSIGLKKANVSGYSLETDNNNYPNSMLTPINELDFSFSATKNQNGHYSYILDGKEYCVGNDIAEFFDNYTRKIELFFFPVNS